MYKRQVEGSAGINPLGSLPNIQRSLDLRHQDRVWVAIVVTEEMGRGRGRERERKGEGNERRGVERRNG